MGSHDHAPDPRNDEVIFSVNGRLVPRREATVHVFDSGFMLGDGVWESFRVEGGAIPFWEDHVERLFEGARALDLDLGLSRTELRAAVDACLDANGMVDGVHVRLMVTRGLRSTPYQSPRVVVSGPTVVIAPEHKVFDPATAEKGMRLITVSQRRGRPDVQDPKLNSHSKLNCILACIQAEKAGADEGLMLDPQGFVATCNSTHFFIVRRGEVWTSTGRYCLAGITRSKVIDLCRELEVPVFEKDFSLTEVHGADEAFVTGTFAGLIPVASVDGRVYGDGTRGPVTERLQRAYRGLVAAEIARQRA